MMNGERGRFDYDECGNGPTVVLVPGSCSTAAAWRPIIAQWENGFRCVTTSLLGYGGTAERRTALDADISHEAEMLEAVIRRASCPVHLVGHSFGGLVALAVALRNRVKLLSLAIIEAPAAELLRSLGEHQHYRAFRDMTDSYFAAFFAGEKAAIEAMIDFYGGAGTFAAWPQRVRSYAVETTAVNIVDWKGAYGFQPAPASLATVEVPTLVLRGGASHPAVQRANELVAECMPKASVVTLPGAAHFMITTHAEEVAWMIAHHVACSEPMSRSTAERSSLLPGQTLSRGRPERWVELRKLRASRRFSSPLQEGCDAMPCNTIERNSTEGVRS
jgi:pimeloyl-ACP methyl ester carboxylesterase